MRTKPYVLGDLWQKFGVMAAAVLARAAEGTELLLRLIRDFGKETRDVAVSLAPNSGEPFIIAPVDDGFLSELSALQVEYGDTDVDEQAWDVDRLVFKVRDEGQSGG